MRYILLFLLLFSTAKAQTSVIQLKEVLIRYNSAIIPQPLCIGSNCAYNFLNSGDTLATVYNEGVVDIRATVAIKDTLSRISIVEPNGTLSANRTIFNGIVAVSFPVNKYYVRSTSGQLPLKVYRTSDNTLYVEIGQNLTWWHLPIPSATTITTQIKRFLLP